MSDAPEELPVGYALWAVLRRDRDASAPVPDGAVLADAVAGLAAGVTLRGIYDVSGLRADADIMFWLTGPDAADLQSSLRTVRRALPGSAPAWNALGVHREAEFSAAHAPA